jgi:hypothetical protein
MNGEFTNYCKQYYNLMLQLYQQEAHFETLLENALPYTGQTNIIELDAILRCNGKILKARADADETRAALHKTEKTILLIMVYFEIQPETKLICEIAGEVKLEIYTKENNRLYCFKTKDLAPLEKDPNMITIEMNHNRYVRDDEDD